MAGVVNRPSSSVRSSSLPAHTEAPRRGAPVSASRTRPRTGRSTGGAGAAGEEDAAASCRWRRAEGDEGSYHQNAEEDRPLLLLVVVRSVTHSHSQITRYAREAQVFFSLLHCRA